MQLDDLARKLLTEHPRTTVIWVVYKYMIIWTAVHNFPTASFYCSFVPKKNSKKVVYCNIFSDIILLRWKLSMQTDNQVPNKEDQGISQWTFGTPS